MGVLDGYDQKQIYVEHGLWPLVTVLAQKLDIPIYKLVNDALRTQLRRHLSATERKALATLFRSQRNEPDRTVKAKPARRSPRR